MKVKAPQSHSRLAGTTEPDGPVPAAEALVVELLPSAAYRLKLENEDVVVAHPAGATKANFLRLRPGDRVRVELSPRDKTRGRIVELLRG